MKLLLFFNLSVLSNQINQPMDQSLEDLMLRAAGELPESGAGSTGHLFQATEEEMKSRYWAWKLRRADILEISLI